MYSIFDIAGDAGSTVFGSLTDGVFEGKIIAKHGSYYVEKAKHYFPHDHNDTFHSVIYKEHDVNDPHAHLREGNKHTTSILSPQVIKVLELR